MLARPRGGRDRFAKARSAGGSAICWPLVFGSPPKTQVAVVTSCPRPAGIDKGDRRSLIQMGLTVERSWLM